MKKINREFILKTAVIALALFIVFNFSSASGIFNQFISVLKPVFVGIFVAMILAVPQNFFEKKVFGKVKNKKWKKAFSLVCTFSLFAGCILLLAFLVLPQSIDSIREIAAMMSSENAWNERTGNNKFLVFLVENGQKMYGKFCKEISTYLPQIITTCKLFVNGVYNILFGVFIAVLLLIGKDSISRQFNNMLLLILPEDKTKKVYAFLHHTFSKFSRYLGGQVTEAFILGIVTYCIMLLLGIPYPALIALIVGFVNLIPIVGAYIGGAVCFVLIFASDPSKALIFIVADVVLQQVESFTTYPVIVGKYVGLSSFWITVSVLVWGGLFGFWGLLLGVPLTAVLQDILRAKSLAKKECKPIS